MMKPIARKQHTSPWGWVPTLYFAEGLPYVAVMTLSVILYKLHGFTCHGLSNHYGALS